MHTVGNSVSFRYMAHSDVSLHWRSDRIAKIMQDNGIRTRGQLSSKTRLSRTTVYRSFTSDWQGVATANVLNVLARVFNVPFAQLTVEPFIEELL